MYAYLILQYLQSKLMYVIYNIFQTFIYKNSENEILLKLLIQQKRWRYFYV